MNTISPSLFRKVNGIKYIRSRINTPDGDFIDFDRSPVNSKSVVIINHGLEGNSYKAYVMGSVLAVNEIGLDAVAINLRGCSEEANLLFSSYHSGKTDDLKFIVNHILNNFDYENIILLGFSLGGNITLKYLGEQGSSISNIVKAAIAISVPCDLKSSAIHLAKRSNWIYMQRFLKTLKKKALFKIRRHQVTTINQNKIRKARNFFEFDNIFTAPVHGFTDANDYWHKCSSLTVLNNISIPCLVINALDDPFLPNECYPYHAAEQNPKIYLETPKFGGHVGFMTHYHFDQKLWHESRIIEFLKEYA